MLQSTNCFQHVDSENVCWDWIQETPTGVQFLDIQKGTGHACGIKTDQTIVCWGANVANLLDAPAGRIRRTNRRRRAQLRTPQQRKRRMLGR